MPIVVQSNPKLLAMTIRRAIRSAGFISTIKYCDGSALHPAGDGFHTYLIKSVPCRRHPDIGRAIESALLEMLTLPAMVLIEIRGRRFSALGVGGNPALVDFCTSYVSQGQ